MRGGAVGSAARSFACAAVLAPAALLPCIWDSDTLASELRGLPEAFDLVTGRWHRHSEAYYRERLERLGGERELTLAELDDLAVAHERLGDHDAAIAVMARKHKALANTPDDEHRYRYHANFGTFLAHAGRFDEGLVELRRAVAINPDAHFGRERFQIELIEYIAAARKDPELWSSTSFLRHAGYAPKKNSHALGVASGFRERESWDGDRGLDRDKAFTAIGGMLRFGGIEGPELYRTLGELFLMDEHLHLAWWAFRHAIERGHPATPHLTKSLNRLRDHWLEAVKHEPTGMIVPTEELYRKRRAEADRWLASFQELEAAAIARGEEVRSDAALQRLLAAADATVPRPSTTPRFTLALSNRQALVVASAATLLTAIVLLLLRRRRVTDRPA